MPRGQRLNNITKEYLIEEYVVKSRYLKDIAKDNHCSEAAISLRLEKFGLRHNIKEKYLNHTFGMLTPYKYIGNDKNKHAIFLCKCQCGKEIKVLSNSLISGNTTTCGCQSRKRGKEHGLWAGYEEITSTTISTLQYGAKIRNLEWSITPNQMWKLYLKQNKRCALTGIPIYFAPTRKKYTLQTASLDRIDSKKGYTIDNIQWVHKTINRMKQHFDEKDFIYFCKLVAKYR